MMFSKQKNLVFEFKRERIVSLHMWFVHFPIDVIFLDRYKKVVETKQNLKPWKFYTPKNKAKWVIELKKGTIQQSKTEVGDKIEF